MRNALLIVIFVSVPLSAQNTDTARKFIIDPGLTGPFANMGQLTLRSSEEGTSVRAQVGVEFPGATDDDADWLFSIGAQASIEKKEEVDFVTLSGLTGGTSADARLTRIQYGTSYNPLAVIQTCEAYNDDRLNRLFQPTTPCGSSDRSACRGRVLPPIDIAARECTHTTIMSRIDAIKEDLAREDLRRLYKDAVDAAAIGTCIAFNTAGAGAYIPEPTTTCIGIGVIDTAKAAEAISSATSKPEGASCAGASSPSGCWQEVLADNVAKARTTFCQALNNDESVLGLIATTGAAAHCNLDTLAEKDKEYREQIAAAMEQKLNAPRSPSVRSWYDQAIRDIRLKPTYLGIKATVKSDTFTYATGSILDEKAFTKETKQGLGLDLAYGRLFVRTRTYVGVAGAIERAYEGAKALQVCESIPNTAQTVCRTLAPSAPTRKDNEIVTVEARHFLYEDIALNPRLSYEFNEGTFGADLVAYLFTSEKKGLNGGVHASYRDDKGDLGIAVFIGAPFHLFGND